tara:strand:+ start:13123 stop:14931 length:1809 start_codon:yes stop_codon:yes gene_type:complete
VKIYSHNFFIYSLVLLNFLSCSQDFYPIGDGLVSDLTLETDLTTIPVFTFQESVDQVQSNGLTHAQLGLINHPVFGRAEASIITQINITPDPVFGNLRQPLEEEEGSTDANLIPENETVKEVYLEIPFFSNTDDADNDGVIDSLDADPNNPDSNSDDDNLTDIEEFQSGLNPLNSDSDGDGILDHDDDENDSYQPENREYQIDSIYGNRNASFNLQVHELTYYLNNLDSSTNFESAQIYYSNRDYFDEGYVGSTLFNETISLNFDEIRLNYSEDDPETLDINETTQVETRLSPRLRIPLDSNFFQKKLFDLEGSDVLSGVEAFNKVMRGFVIRADNFSDDLYMLLDIQNGVIKIQYEFDDYNTQTTSINKVERELSLSLGGNQINSLKNSAFESAIEQRIVSSKNNEPTDKLYIQSSRLHGKIRLFEDENLDTNSLLENIRIKSWLINEANLIFYIDPGLTSPESLTAQRLYLFNYESGTPIVDYIIDGSISSSGTNSSKENFGGILELDDNNKPYRYKFNLTNHVSNIIRKDSTNYDLGLVVTANIANPFAIKAQKDLGLETFNYPVAATLNPLGTVLVGSHPNSSLDDKKVKLELIFSSY